MLTEVEKYLWFNCLLRESASHAFVRQTKISISTLQKGISESFFMAGKFDADVYKYNQEETEYSTG
jgi:hypothetical protein